jgi:hypothetical protein
VVGRFRTCATKRSSLLPRRSLPWWPPELRIPPSRKHRPPTKDGLPARRTPPAAGGWAACPSPPAHGRRGPFRGRSSSLLPRTAPERRGPYRDQLELEIDVWSWRSRLSRLGLELCLELEVEVEVTARRSVAPPRRPVVWGAPPPCCTVIEAYAQIRAAEAQAGGEAHCWRRGGAAGARAPPPPPGRVSGSWECGERGGRGRDGYGRRAQGREGKEIR